MLSKNLLFITLAAFTSFAVATPPGCMLGAINEFDDPSDISAVCKTKDATSKVASFCPDDVEDALKAFADICKEAGVEVSTKIPTSTGSASPTSTGGSGSGSGSGNSPASPTTSGGLAAASGSTSTANTPESTGSAGKLEIAGAALLAGLVAVAL